MRALILLMCAGLLASCSSAVTVPAAEQGEPTSPVATQPPAGQTTTAALEPAMQQVLVATRVIPRGTSVGELLEDPIVYLKVEVASADFIAPGAISSVEQLQSLAGFVLAADVLEGDRLTRVAFRDPSDFATAPRETPTLELPVGHTAHVLELPTVKAVGGFILPGEVVRVVQTSVDSEGSPVSTILFEAVEVMNVEAQIDEGADVVNNPACLAVTIALKPDEASALPDPAAITLVSDGLTPNTYGLAIEMTAANALDGQVRMGGVVDIMAVSALQGVEGKPEPVARGVEVLQVSAQFGVADSPFVVFVSVDADELLRLTETIANSEITLALRAS